MEIQHNPADKPKWFIYLVDHHEGPFTSAGILDLIKQGRATPAHYVWCEGMADWDVLSTVSEFRTQQSEPTLTMTRPAPVEAAEAAPATETPPAAEAAPVAEPMPVAEPVVVADPEVPGLEATSLESLDVQPLEITTDAAAPAPAPNLTPAAGYVAPVQMKPAKPGKKVETGGTPAPKKTRRLFRFLGIFLLLLGVGFAVTSAMGIIQPWLVRPELKWLDPAAQAIYKLTGRFFTNVPQDLKISAQDREAMEAAIRSNLKTDGIRVAFGPTQDDPLQPAIHVAANLPEGAVVNVWVEGVPDTLLNHFQFVSQSRIVMTGKLGKTGKILSADGKPMPRGKYFVRVFVPSIQNEDTTKVIAEMPVVTQLPDPKIAEHKPKFFTERSMFLGGPDDETYRSRLSDFHKKVREKAAKELLELRQFLQALSGQMDLSIAKFSSLANGQKSRKQTTDWKKFRGQWAQFTDHMNRQFKTWNDQGIADVFYQEIYSAMKDAGALVVQAHEAQNRYFEGNDRALTIESKIKINEAVTQAEAALDRIKRALEDAGDPLGLGSGLPKKPEMRK